MPCGGSGKAAMRFDENFRAAMHAAGLEFDGQLIADGKLHRRPASNPDHHSITISEGRTYADQ